MKHYVGLDVSQKEVSICVVDADGNVIVAGKAATEPSDTNSPSIDYQQSMGKR